MSIACVRAVFEQLAIDNIRSALDLAESACRVATSRDGLRVFKQHGVDVLTALVGAPDILTLPAEFRETRYPQMLDYLRKKRSL